MEKTKQILVLVILCGVALYFLPVAMDTFGISKAEGETGAIALSSDGGKNFQGSVIHSSSVPDIIDIVRSGTDSRMFFAATDRGIFLSRDGGVNWYPFSDLEGNVGAGTYVYDILVNPNAPKETYVAISKNGKGEVYVTRDNFFTLSRVFDEEVRVRALAAGDGEIYFSLADGRVVTYYPYSKTFSFQASDVNNIFTASLAAYPSTGGYANSALAAVAPPRTKVTANAEYGSLMLLGSDEKLYRSEDFGAHWSIKEPIDKSRSISVIRVFSQNGIVVIGSKGGFSLAGY